MAKNELATTLLINEIERRFNLIQSETTDLREQMISNLLIDIEKFKDIEQQNIIKAFDKGYEEPFSDDDFEWTKGREYFYDYFEYEG